MGFFGNIRDAVSKVVPVVKAAAPVPAPVAKQVAAPASKVATPAPKVVAQPAPKTVVTPPKVVTPKRFGRFSAGGSTGSASKRADGIAQKGKTKGRMI